MELVPVVAPRMPHLEQAGESVPEAAQLAGIVGTTGFETDPHPELAKPTTKNRSGSATCRGKEASLVRSGAVQPPQDLNTVVGKGLGRL